jgi:hypothetical protein
MLNKNNGTGGTNSVSVAYNAAMPAITAPTRSGQTFLGYYSATTGGYAYYTPQGISARNFDKTSDTTLYAQWGSLSATCVRIDVIDQNNAGNVKTSPSVFYISNNGAWKDSACKTALSTFDILPTKTGMDFVGFIRVPGASNIDDPNGMLYYGGFMNNPYTISTYPTRAIYAIYQNSIHSLTYKCGADGADLGTPHADWQYTPPCAQSGKVQVAWIVDGNTNETVPLSYMAKNSRTWSKDVELTPLWDNSNAAITVVANNGTTVIPLPVNYGWTSDNYYVNCNTQKALTGAYHGGQSGVNRGSCANHIKPSDIVGRLNHLPTGVATSAITYKNGHEFMGLFNTANQLGGTPYYWWEGYDYNNGYNYLGNAIIDSGSRNFRKNSVANYNEKSNITLYARYAKNNTNSNPSSNNADCPKTGLTANDSTCIGYYRSGATTQEPCKNLMPRVWVNGMSTGWSTLPRNEDNRYVGISETSNTSCPWALLCNAGYRFNGFICQQCKSNEICPGSGVYNVRLQANANILTSHINQCEGNNGEKGTLDIGELFYFIDPTFYFAPSCTCKTGYKLEIVDEEDAHFQRCAPIE